MMSVRVLTPLDMADRTSSATPLDAGTNLQHLGCSTPCQGLVTKHMQLLAAAGPIGEQQF